MKLLEIEFLGLPLSLIMQPDGQQCLYVADQLVSEVNLSSSHSPDISHRFNIEHENKAISVSLNLQAQQQKAQYQLWCDDQQIKTGEFQLHSTQVIEKPKQGFMGLLALAFKLFKSAKVIKVALAGASVAGYAWLFSLEFALVLVTCLVAHEFGHVKAMKYFGIKTKGIYLIPFVGGLAVSDDKINSRWQNVVISIMGPCFGLLMSIICLVLYTISDIELFAGAAVLSALLNLFNLLPILPLDGGHILKSISFSMRSWVGLSVCMSGIALGLWLAYTFSLSLLVFFLVIGSLEAIFEWRLRHQSHLIPLNRYAQIFSAIWYVLVMAGHIMVIVSFADSENPILSLPMKILGS